jgi:C-terminal processing protease CtpA/Prc
VKKAVPTSFVASDPSWPPFQTHSRIDPRPATDIMVMDPDGKVIAVQKFTSKEQADIFTQSLRRFERFGLNVGPMREEDDAVVSKLKSEGFNSALRVKGVRAGSPAAEAGLRADDLIVEVGNKSVPDVVAFAASVGRAQGPIVFTIQRGDNRVAIQALFE